MQSIGEYHFTALMEAIEKYDSSFEADFKSDAPKKDEKKEKLQPKTENVDAEEAKAAEELRIEKFDEKIKSLKAELYHYTEWTNHTPYGEILWTPQHLSSLLALVKQDFHLDKSRKLQADQIESIIEITENILNKALKAIKLKKGEVTESDKCLVMTCIYGY